jgi:two-component system, OmpR family, sensor kinase
VRRRLQGRLLVWFLAAIVLAIVASTVTAVLTNSGGDAPSRVLSRHVQQRAAKLWDDPGATEAYVDGLRDTTGLDLRVRREPLPSVRPRAGGVVLEDGIATFPIVKRGVVVGAIELRTEGHSPQGWRILLALVAALLVLGLFARRASMRIARPIEHVAAAAERFGAGDLGARVAVERMPRRWLTDEVRDLGRAFDGMAERISRVVLDQRELLGAISHELRSPLGRARVALEIARDQSSGEPRKPLDDIERQLVEMDAILSDLLASARAGLGDLRREPVAIGDWLRERSTAEGGPIEVEIERDVRVPIDPALLGRALHNVIANARAHGHPTGDPLRITCRKNGSMVTIRVRDRGPGFDPEVLPRAFDPFVTGGDKARSPGEHGVGLGLSLVRRIVEAHGGKVTAENLDEGAAVSIELPC